MDPSTNNKENTRRRKYLLTRRLDRFFIELAQVYAFIARFFKEVFFPPYEFKEIIRQCYEVGVRSLPLISITGFIIGIVFTNQSRPSLRDFGATSLLPALISIAIVRAIGPLVTAIIAAGRVGSSIGAELGSMRVTEQIDAMLGFAARHGVLPKTEHFPMSRANEALAHLRAGKARYRIVLDADFG